MDTEELLYDIKRKLDEVAIAHQYSRTAEKRIWTDMNLTEIVYLEESGNKEKEKTIGECISEFEESLNKLKESLK